MAVLLVGMSGALADEVGAVAGMLALTDSACALMAPRRGKASAREPGHMCTRTIPVRPPRGREKKSRAQGSFAKDMPGYVERASEVFRRSARMVRALFDVPLPGAWRLDHAATSERLRICERMGLRFPSKFAKNVSTSDKAVAGAY